MNRAGPIAAPIAAPALAPPAPHWMLAPSNCGHAAGPSGRCAACEGAMRFGAGVTVSKAGDAHEIAADRLADRVMRGPAPARRILAPATGGPAHGGAPLPAPTRSFFEPRFGRALHDVRIHDDGAARAAAGAIAARAYTAGSHIFFGAGEYAPGTAAGRHLLAHELAHVVHPAPAGRIARKALADLPEATRKQLTISRAVIAAATVANWVAQYFDPASGVTAPEDKGIEYGPGLTDPAQRKGLSGIVYELKLMSRRIEVPAGGGSPAETRNADPKEWPLPANMVYDLALDLRAFAGDHAVYRFIRYQESGTDRILIEKPHILAPATAAAAKVTPANPVTPATPVTSPPPAAAPATGVVTIDNVSVTIDKSLGDDKARTVAAAIRLMPAPIRARIDGITITLGGTGAGPGGRFGDYDGNTDVVRLWTDAFTPTPFHIGAANEAAYVVVHELGHAVDLRPHQSALARQRAEAKRQALDRQLNPRLPIDPSKLGLDEKPAVLTADQQAQKKRLADAIAVIDREIATIKAKGDQPTAAGSELGFVDVDPVFSTDFGKALLADGVKAIAGAKARNDAKDQIVKRNATLPPDQQVPVGDKENVLSHGTTEYADVGLTEAFADNFAIYIADDLLLKALRPHVSAYFAKAFPKPPPAPPAKKTP